MANQPKMLGIIMKEKHIYYDLITLSALFGGANISRSFLINGLDLSLDNKKIIINAALQGLEAKKLISSTVSGEKIFISLLLQPGDLELILNDQEKIRAIIPKALTVLSQAFNKEWDSLVVFTYNNPNVITMAECFLANIHKLGFSGSDTLALKVHLLDYYVNIRKHDKALKLMRDIEENHKFEGDDSNDLYVLFLINKGNLVVTHFSENKTMCQKTTKEVEAAFKAVLKEENGNHSKSFIICARLAHMHLLQGDIDTSIECLNKCEDLIAQVDKIQYKAIFHSISSWVYLEAGQYEKSIFHSNKAVKYLENFTPTPMLFFSYNMQIWANIALGLYDQSYISALSSLQRARLFNVATPTDYKAEAMLGIAKSAFYKGNFIEAENYALQARHEYKMFFNGDDKHIDQADVPHLLGKILMAQGKIPEAKTYLMESLNIYNKLLRKPGYDDLGNLYQDLAIVAKQNGNMTESFEYLKLHSDQFGIKHPRTINMKNELLGLKND